MAAQLGGNDDEPISAINVVPLVDIILVVLIIFMVTAPLVLNKKIDINLPKAASGDEAPPTPLNVAVTRDGGIILNGKPSSLEDVTAYASAMVKERPETPALLQADKDVTLERLTAVIDQLKLAGVSKMGFNIESK